MGAPSSMTKKQVIECIQRKHSLVAADLRGVDLSGLCFDDMDLRGAKLAECNLARATFRRANLESASFWSTDCKDACFDYANLESADFDFSNLDGATLRHATAVSVFLGPRKFARCGTGSSPRWCMSRKNYRFVRDTRSCTAFGAAVRPVRSGDSESSWAHQDRHDKPLAA